MDDDPSQRIEVTWQSNLAPIPAERVRETVEAVLRAEGCRRAELSVAIVDDAEMAVLHERHLGVAGPTDVLSFDLGVANASQGCGIDGEVVVSAETAARTAQGLGTETEPEVLLYVIHGVLHLLGYEDKAVEPAIRMRAREDEILAALGCAAPVRST